MNQNNRQKVNELLVLLDDFTKQITKSDIESAIAMLQGWQNPGLTRDLHAQLALLLEHLGERTQEAFDIRLEAANRAAALGFRLFSDEWQGRL